MSKPARHTRLTPQQRLTVIEAAAVQVANEKGLLHVNPESVAKKCEISTSAGTVRYHCRTREDLINLIVNSEHTVDVKVLALAESWGFKKK